LLDEDAIVELNLPSCFSHRQSAFKVRPKELSLEGMKTINNFHLVFLSNGGFEEYHFGSLHKEFGTSSWIVIRS
jgi:hypothetical protein